MLKALSAFLSFSQLHLIFIIVRHSGFNHEQLQQIIFMKSKIRNLLREDSRPQSRSHERISYTKIKTKPSYEEELEDSVWSNSFKYIQPFSAKNSSNPDTFSVMRQNEQLKLQIIRLKHQLSKYQCDKHLSKISLRTISEENCDQSGRLKQILEKSYYSIKQMEKDIKKLQNELIYEQKSHGNTEKKLKLAILEKEELQRKMETIISIHKQQMKVCNQRINKLQGHLSQLIDHMEYDQKEWKRHMEDLKTFKKFSFKRTYQ